MGSRFHSCSKRVSFLDENVPIYKMKIIVIGANGQLGWELCKRGEQMDFNILALDLPEFDITHRATVNEILGQTDISLIINAAAYTAVDKAESEPQCAFAINRDGPFYIASRCSKSGIPLIHISTDYVFDGIKKSPYLETDPVAPLNVYGKSKAAGEEYIRRIFPKHIIIRTSWLYGVHGHNFVKTMLRLGTERELLHVVNDQFGSPTYAGDLAHAILTIASYFRDERSVQWGTYHYCGKGETTWHGFAEKIFSFAWGRYPLVVKSVEGITTAEYPTAAKRPANSTLDCSLIKSNFGISPPPWEKSLENVVFEIINNYA